jgi:predicted deacylase
VAREPRRADARAGRGVPVTIGGVTVPAGRRAPVEIPVARLPTGASMSLPVMVVNGRRPGPRVWLSAVLHGDELNGVDIIRQVLAAVTPRELAGTVVAVPIVNGFGMLHGTRYLPDRRDLNRSFPGSPTGSLAARLAHLFMTEIVSACDVGLDLHTGSDHRYNLPQVRGDLDEVTTRDLADAFAAPVSVHAPVRDGSLREACTRRGIPVLVYEGGEADRFNAAAIDCGVAGILRVLAHLGMRDGGETAPPAPTRVVRHTQWVRARRSGIFRSPVRAGDVVGRGDALGIIADAFGGSRSVVRAPLGGIVIGHTQHPLVNRGDALVHVADTDPAATGPAARAPRGR